MDPLDRLRSVGRRITDPAELIAQQVAERVIEPLVGALDINGLAARVDLNAVLRRVDLDEILTRMDVNVLLKRVDMSILLDKIDVNAVLDRVDFNDVVRRIDMDALVEQADLGAVIARSSGGAAGEALDLARSQAVGLDQFIDRWVRRMFRRKHPDPLAPPALLAARAEQ